MGDQFVGVGPGSVIIHNSVISDVPRRAGLRTSQIVAGLQVREVSTGLRGEVVRREFQGRFVGADVRFSDGVRFVQASGLEIV